LREVADRIYILVSLINDAAQKTLAALSQEKRALDRVCWDLQRRLANQEAPGDPDDPDVLAKAGAALTEEIAEAAAAVAAGETVLGPSPC